MRTRRRCRYSMGTGISQTFRRAGQTHEYKNQGLDIQGYQIECWRWREMDGYNSRYIIVGLYYFFYLLGLPFSDCSMLMVTRLDAINNQSEKGILLFSFLPSINISDGITASQETSMRRRMMSLPDAGSKSSTPLSTRSGELQITSLGHQSGGR
jgi:hypothetical protein